VRGFAADLVIGMKQGFGQQGTDVASAQPVQHAATVPARLHQAREAQLGQVLTGHGWAAPCKPGEGRNVKLLMPQSPQHPHPGGVSQQEEGPHRGVNLLSSERVGMPRCRVNLGGTCSNHGHSLTTAITSHVRIYAYHRGT